MADRTPGPHRKWLFVRLVIASGLVGLAFGFYLQVIGRVEMTAFLTFEFVTRAAIMGAFFWAFELFFIHGPKGMWFRKQRDANRLVFRVVAYLVVLEIGFVLGEVAFHPDRLSDPLGLIL